jgi:hypothetical protein
MNGLAAEPRTRRRLSGGLLSCPHAGSAIRIRQETLQVGLLTLPGRPAFPPRGSGYRTGPSRGLQRRDRSGFAPDSLLWPGGHLKDIVTEKKLPQAGKDRKDHSPKFDGSGQPPSSGRPVRMSRQISALFNEYRWMPGAPRARSSRICRRAISTPLRRTASSPPAWSAS